MPHWRHLYASDVRAPENSFEHGRQKIAARQTGGSYFLFTSSLSCSFLLIFLYRWNSPDPALLDRGSAHVLGWDLLLSTLLPSARLSGSHWSFGWLSAPPLVLDPRNQLCWSKHQACQGTFEPLKTTTKSQKVHLSTLFFAFTKYYATKKIFYNANFYNVI